MKIPLIVIGTLLQAVGVLAAAVGIRNVRRGWSTNPGIVGRSREVVVVVSSSVTGWLRRTFRRSRHTKPAYLSGRIASASGVSGTLGVAIGKVVDRTWPEAPEAQMDWLRERISELASRQDGLQTGLADLSSNHHQAGEWTKEELARLQSEPKLEVSHLAVGGLKLQTFGVLCLIAGTLIGAWGNLIG